MHPNSPKEKESTKEKSEGKPSKKEFIKCRKKSATTQKYI